MDAHEFTKTADENGIITPALTMLPPQIERYPVKSGGSVAIEMQENDSIQIINIEGNQIVEVFAFDKKGRADANIIGAHNNNKKDNLEKIFEKNLPAIKILQNILIKRGADQHSLQGAKIFDYDSKPAEQKNYSAKQKCWLMIIVPERKMLAWEQNLSSDIVIYVTRAQPRKKNEIIKPPEPLSEPQYDINIMPGRAKAYIVAKGDFIQIIDIQGRECSDFQAFSLRALDKGCEREIDPTATRSMMATLYPTPGIFSKYFSCDLEPLVEIVQDTCGRHDTFGLACTARYYEDMGYPGHINCTDNMNKVLADYNIKKRGGWPSINFFFNTILTDDQAIIMDEPWSRPGDYVLLRALTELVCVSTACPCDIDAANGWNPTDIQVRLYDKKNTFRKSIGWRKKPEGDMIETKKTAFHKCFEKYTREFSEYNGYWLPQKMHSQGAISEYWACRKKAAIMDLSPLRKYEVIGPDAEKLMQLCVTRNIKSLAVGQVVYTAMCYEHGGMIDDGTVFRLADNNFRWVGGNDDSGLWLKKQAQELQLNVWVKTSSEQLCNIAVQGPLSRQILAPVFWTPPAQPTIEELKWFRFTLARIKDFQGAACIVSRTGYTGELGYEIFCHPDDAVKVFQTIWQSGEPLGLKPLGLQALDILRVEAGLIFAGYEFSDEIDPFEAGIGFCVPLETKQDDFIGKKNLLERKKYPQKKLVGLELKGSIVPLSKAPIYKGKAKIGEITSAVKSPVLGKNIALARITKIHANIEENVEVGQLDGHQKRLTATITKFPHFDPQKQRVKGNYQQNV